MLEEKKNKEKKKQQQAAAVCPIQSDAMAKTHQFCCEKVARCRCRQNKDAFSGSWSNNQTAPGQPERGHEYTEHGSAHDSTEKPAVFYLCAVFAATCRLEYQEEYNRDGHDHGKTTRSNVSAGWSDKEIQGGRRKHLREVVLTTLVRQIHHGHVPVAAHDGHVPLWEEKSKATSGNA